MQIIADLHIHSKFSRAVSSQMVLPEIAKWAKIKGIKLMATGDFMHPLWFREIKSNLMPLENGFFKLADKNLNNNEVSFILSAEISSIYSQGGKLRRIHNLIYTSSLESADKINSELTKRGCNLISDGRPIVGISSRDLAELVFTIDPSCLFVPAHIWTPWFSLFGSESGFDSIDECFGDMSKYIHAVETGLSSDPAMNWRIGELDNRSILSSSDAHSGAKLGREVTVLKVKSTGQESKSDLSYEDFVKAIKQDSSGKWEISYTVEFYPEEGKYHYTGHRNCGVRQSPEETKKLGTTCSVCGKKLTIGVMHRVSQLASREDISELSIININGVSIRMFRNKSFNRPPFTKIVPLQEILSEALGGMPASQKIQGEYQKLVFEIGSEFKVLLATPYSEITKISGEKVAEGIEKVRNGDIVVAPGYDGEFGKVKIWGSSIKTGKTSEKQVELGQSQLSLDL